MIKTYSAKPQDVARQWYLVDAKGQTLGRLASEIATYLTGKHKPTYTAHIDTGDVVVVINAGDIKITGNKLLQKKYYRHSGYPGGIYETSLESMMESSPEKAIINAVKGMLPKNKLQAERLKRLKVYAGSDHPHEPQKPKSLTFGGKK
jgi:large subunit ribosomal protein L13